MSTEQDKLFLSGQEDEFEDFLLLNPQGKARLLQKYAHHAVQETLDLPWKDIPYNRVALMGDLARRIGPRCRYLEIGCAQDELFAALPIRHKIGVDPVQGGNRRMTSDTFFGRNTKNFDLIFLDGLHTYEQLHTDVNNALEVVAPGGYIGIHDLVPRTWQEEHVPRVSGMWTGDVWKVACEIAETPALDFKIVMIDHGVGLIRVGDGPQDARPAQIVDLSAELRDASFATFLAKFPDLPKVEWAELPDWLDGPDSFQKGSGT